MHPALDQLQARIGYTFRDPTLLRSALTHTSLAAEIPDADNNQRLEFLGDAVLQILLAEALFHLFPQEREGVLSKRRALLVNEAFLAGLTKEIGADACLFLGKSEEKYGGRNRPSLLGDAFEAIVGALYLDSDLPTARRIVMALYGDLSVRLLTTEADDNPKGRLQELVQPLHGNTALRYDVMGIAGEDHAPEYEVAVFLFDRRVGTGRGTSKKLAEESAARAALASLGPSKSL